MPLLRPSYVRLWRLDRALLAARRRGGPHPLSEPQPEPAQHVPVRDGQAGDGHDRLQPAEAHRLAHVPARLPAEAHRQIEGTTRARAVAESTANKADPCYFLPNFDSFSVPNSKLQEESEF